MFTIVKNEQRTGIWHRDAPVPGEPGFGEVTVSVEKAGICGTDYHIWLWDAWSSQRIKTPVTIGHEFVGRITTVGPGVTHLHEGDRVSVECHITCGFCVQCRTGKAHLCKNVSIIGVDRDGCFAEHITVPASNVWSVPDDIPDHHAAVFDPVGNAMHTVTSVPVTGRDVLVVGAGAIGLFAAAIAHARGARRVIIQEPSPYRAALAESLGIGLVVDPTRPETRQQIIDATDGLGPPAILEMSGNANALSEALRLAPNGGHVALLGIPSGTVELALGEDVIMKGLTLHGITGRRMFETWYEVESFMQRHPELMDKIITHVLPAERYAEGFELMHGGVCGKVVLDFNTVAK